MTGGGFGGFGDVKYAVGFYCVGCAVGLVNPTRQYEMLHHHLRERFNEKTKRWSIDPGS